MTLTPEQENQYLESYFEQFSQTEEYKGMSKREVKKHLEGALQDYRILMAEMWGQVKCAKMLGHPAGIRIENILTGNSTQH